jgi:hypothetical protein
MPNSVLKESFQKEGLEGVCRLLLKLQQNGGDEEDYEEVVNFFAQTTVDLQSKVLPKVLQLAATLLANRGKKLHLPSLNKALSEAIHKGDTEAFAALISLKYPLPLSSQYDRGEWEELILEMLQGKNPIATFTILCNTLVPPIEFRGIALLAAIKVLNVEIASFWAKRGSLLFSDRIEAIRGAISMGPTDFHFLGLLCDGESIPSRNLREFILQALDEKQERAARFFAFYGEIKGIDFGKLLMELHKRGEIDLCLKLLNSRNKRDNSIQQVIVEAASVNNKNFIEFLSSKTFQLSEEYRVQAIVTAIQEKALELCESLLAFGPLDVIRIRDCLDAAILYKNSTLFELILQKNKESIALLSTEDRDSLFLTALTTGIYWIECLAIRHLGKTISHAKRVEAIQQAIQAKDKYRLDKLLDDESFGGRALDDEALSKIFDQLLLQRDGYMWSTLILHPFYEPEIKDPANRAEILRAGVIYDLVPLVETLLSSSRTKHYSLKKWVALMGPSLREAIADHSAKMVENLLAYGKISQGLQEECLSQAKGFPKIMALLSAKKVTEERHPVLRRWVTTGSKRTLRLVKQAKGHQRWGRKGPKRIFRLMKQAKGHHLQRASSTAHLSGRAFFDPFEESKLDQLSDRNQEANPSQSPHSFSITRERLRVYDYPQYLRKPAGTDPHLGPLGRIRYWYSDNDPGFPQ